MVCQILISTLRGRFSGMEGADDGCGADRLVELFLSFGCVACGSVGIPESQVHLTENFPYLPACLFSLEWSITAVGECQTMVKLEAVISSKQILATNKWHFGCKSRCETNFQRLKRYLKHVPCAVLSGSTVFFASIFPKTFRHIRQL